MSTFPPIRESPPILAPASQQQQQSATWWAATIPSADVRAIGGSASPGFQARAHWPTIHRAGCPQYGPSGSTHRPSTSACFPPHGHQTGTTWLLLWFWWVTGFRERLFFITSQHVPTALSAHLILALVQQGRPLVGCVKLIVQGVWASRAGRRWGMCVAMFTVDTNECMWVLACNRGFDTQVCTHTHSLKAHSASFL